MDIEDLLDDETLVRECPCCYGWSIPLGILGNLVWYICNDCGMYFYVELERAK